jgi:predicted transcriptional regulator
VNVNNLEIAVGDLVKTVKAQLYDRLSSPLVFSFAISWLAWNYKAIVIILSALSPTDKFLAIEMLALQWENQIWYWLISGFFGPLITATCYIFALPFLDEIVFGYTLKKKKKLKEIRQEIEDETPISVDEARELRAALTSAQDEYEKTLAARHAEIARLKVELRETNEQIEALSVGKSKSRGRMVKAPGLETTQVNLLRFMADYIGLIPLAEILRQSKQDKLKIQYDVDELARREFIQEDDYENHGYSVTAKGRAFLVEGGAKASESVEF